MSKRYEVRPTGLPGHPYQVWDTDLNIQMMSSQTREAADRYAEILNGPDEDESEAKGDQQ